MSLTPEVIAIIAGLIAPFIVQAAKWGGLTDGKTLRWSAFIVSVGLAFGYAGLTGQLPHLPTLTGADPAVDVSTVLAFAGQVVAFGVLAFKTATAFYDVLLVKIFPKPQ